MPLKLEARTKKSIYALSAISTRRFVLAALGDWTVICASVALALAVPSIWTSALAIVLVASRQHGLMILVHDATHFRAHTKMHVNDRLSDWLCAFPIFFDTVIYRARHLQHHEHLNSDRDPDWVRKVHNEEWRFPKTKSALTRGLLLCFLYRGALEWLQAAWYFSGLSKATGLKRDLGRIMEKSVFWAVTLGTLHLIDGLQTFALYWVLPYLLVFPLFQRIRSVAEHFGMTYLDELNSSRDILPSALEAYLLAPHGVHFHLSHHLYPSVPFYNLGRLNKLLHSDPVYLKAAKRNSSYILPVSGSLIADLLIKPDAPLDEQSSKLAA